MLAAGDYFLVTTAIEGARVADLNWGTANARTIVVRFWFNCGTTGLYSFRLANSATNRCYVHQFSYPTASVWMLVSAVVPGDTTGT